MAGNNITTERAQDPLKINIYRKPRPKAKLSKNALGIVFLN